MVEAHQEEEKQHHHHHTYESREEGRRVDPLGRCFGHNDGWGCVVQLIALGFVQRVSEVDFAVGDVPPYLLLEPVVADDELEFIIPGEVLDLFLSEGGSTGSPRSTRAEKRLC